MTMGSTNVRHVTEKYEQTSPVFDVYEIGPSMLVAGYKMNHAYSKSGKWFFLGGRENESDIHDNYVGEGQLYYHDIWSSIFHSGDGVSNRLYINGLGVGGFDHDTLLPTLIVSILSAYSINSEEHCNISTYLGFTLNIPRHRHGVGGYSYWTDVPVRILGPSRTSFGGYCREYVPHYEGDTLVMGGTRKGGKVLLNEQVIKDYEGLTEDGFVVYGMNLIARLDPIMNLKTTHIADDIEYATNIITGGRKTDSDFGIPYTEKYVEVAGSYYIISLYSMLNIPRYNASSGNGGGHVFGGRDANGKNTNVVETLGHGNDTNSPDYYFMVSGYSLINREYAAGSGVNTIGGLLESGIATDSIERKKSISG